MKQVPIFLILFLAPVLSFAQQNDSIVKRDSIIQTDTIVQPDSSFINPAEVLKRKEDSIKNATAAAIVYRATIYKNTLNSLLADNSYLNSGGKPVAMPHHIRKARSKDHYFYLLAGIGVMLGFLRFFYTRYFNNLFRVFFNASLRQSQLTDQLLQAKLPSLFFNIIFIFSGGIYVYFLLTHYNWVDEQHFWKVLGYCTLSLTAIYLVKFISLKFTGWLTGYKEITNTYIFVIFLINKILGILLLPFAVVIAFSVPGLATSSIIISLLLIGLMFLLRFFRSYGLLQHQLKVSRFHFFMYVVGIEVVPVLLIYKGLVLLLSKNL